MTVLSISSQNGYDIKSVKGDDVGNIKDMVNVSNNTLVYYLLWFGRVVNCGDKLHS